MYDTHETILATYRDADFNHRLHMFLQFPRLRSQFTSIDLSEAPSKASAGIASHDRFRVTKAGACLSARVGCVKRLWNNIAV